jgi:hypothetical protein
MAVSKIAKEIVKLKNEGRISKFTIENEFVGPNGSHELNISIYIKYDVFSKNIVRVLSAFSEFCLDGLKEITVDRNSKAYIWDIKDTSLLHIGRLFLYVS